MSGGQHGPAAVRDVLDVYLDDTAGVSASVGGWGNRMLQPEEYRLLKRPRDFAWTQFHAGLLAQGQKMEFDDLWTHLGTLDGGHPPGPVCDAVRVQLLVPYVDQRPFARSDLDTLMAPWKAGVEGCARSRLFLAVSAHPPFDRDFWPTVDAVMGVGDQ